MDSQIERAQWRKSSYSGSNGGGCVEVADLPGVVGVRDSKNPSDAVLTVRNRDWRAFTAALQQAG